MKKLLAICFVLLAAVGCGKKEEVKPIKIGITQIVEHPSLDAARKGVEDALAASEFNDRVEFNYQNAQGDFNTAQMIATSFKDSEDIIVAITTPSAQAAQNQITKKPVFFAAVTNPDVAGLTAPNVTGVSDQSPVEKQVKLIMDLLPEAKKVGIVYNTSEQNSVYLTELFTEKAQAAGLEIVVRGITNVNEVASALDTIMPEIDVLYTSIDNTIASAYPLVIQKAEQGKVPVIGATKPYVDQGALATEGIEDYQVGYQTGEMLIRYLQGEKIEDMPYEKVKNSSLYISSKKVEEYGIQIPEEVKTRANMVD
jgi:putative ABC transport system substrate-binding protein